MKINISKIFLGMGFILIFFLPFTISFWNLIIPSPTAKYFVMFLPLILFILYKKNRNIKLNNKSKILLFLWVMFIFTTMYKNYDVKYSNNYFQIVYYSLIFLFAIILSKKDADWEKKCIDILKVFCFIQLVLGYFCWFNRGFFVNSIIPKMSLSDNGRKILFDCIKNGYLTGMTYHYSTMGMYMSLGTILYSDWIIEPVRKDRKKKLVLFMIYLFSLVLTGKRGPLVFTVLSFILVIMTLFNLKKKKYIRNLLISIILGFIVFSAIYISIPQVRVSLNRFMVSDSLDINEITTGRSEALWDNAILMFKNNKILGNGWRSFRYNIVKYVNINNNDAHNIYLQLLVETGIVGFSIFLILVFSMFVKTFRMLKNDKFKKYNNILIICIIYQLYFVGYGLTGNPLYDCQCFVPFFMTYEMVISIENKKGMFLDEKGTDCN